MPSSKRSSASWPSAARDDFVAVLAQRVGEQLLDRLLVIDEEDPWRVRQASTAPALREIVGWTGREEAALIEPRIYRAAFVPALLAVLLVMFSFESRPPAAAAGPAARRAVRRRAAAAEAQRIADRAPRPPRRHAGRPRRRRAGRARRFAARGFARRVDSASTSDGDRARQRDRPARRARRAGRSW